MASEPSKHELPQRDELAEAINGESYAAAPAKIVEGISEDLAHRSFANAPHTIYAELWHLAFWQQITLDWISGIETPYPTQPADAFPSAGRSNAESFDQLRSRFLHDAQRSAAVIGDTARIDRPVRCPSRPGSPVRIMTARDQLVSLAAHNAYHLGRIVLLRQLQGAWPPASGGFTW